MALVAVAAAEAATEAAAEAAAEAAVAGWTVWTVSGCCARICGSEATGASAASTREAAASIPRAVERCINNILISAIPCPSPFILSAIQSAWDSI